ncbi:hypothetical protein [Nevskia sp.]|uniref:hypothetical protein n=1 Tax=Nevskia sp. TaxID=1929292 RepID=UPI0025D115C6|nr:hypothetical protein [Nevskia sp.]
MARWEEHQKQPFNAKAQRTAKTRTQRKAKKGKPEEKDKDWGESLPAVSIAFLSVAVLSLSFFASFLSPLRLCVELLILLSPWQHQRDKTT